MSLRESTRHSDRSIHAWQHADSEAEAEAEMKSTHDKAQRSWIGWES